VAAQEFQDGSVTTAVLKEPTSREHVTGIHRVRPGDPSRWPLGRVGGRSAFKSEGSFAFEKFFVFRILASILACFAEVN
jgi:hypothetical protein